MSECFASMYLDTSVPSSRRPEGAGVTDSCELLCHLGPMQQQQPVLLSSEPSVQFHLSIFK